MRRQLRAASPDVEVFDATAEALPFADASVDAVVVAQAFHWFDGPRALAEIRRVLRVPPGGGRGGLGLVWNVRDREVEWLQQLADLTEPYRQGVPTYRDGAWREAFESTELFGPLEGRDFPFEHEIDAATMVERMASISWIAVLPDDERTALLGRVRAVLADARLPERFVVPYHTELWWCRPR